MKRYKELTMDEIIILINQCKHYDDIEHTCDEKCPLFGECLYYYTGDDSMLYEN